jgi:hypothetical protein
MRPVPHARTLRRSPQHRILKPKSVHLHCNQRSGKVIVLGRFNRQHRTPGIDRRLDVSIGIPALRIAAFVEPR